MFGRPGRGARRRAQIYVVAFAQTELRRAAENAPSPPRAAVFPSRRRFHAASSSLPRRATSPPARGAPPRPRTPSKAATMPFDLVVRARSSAPAPSPSPPFRARARGPRPSNSRLAIGSPEARAFPSRDRASPLETPRTTHLARARRPTPPRAILSPPPRRTPTLTAPPPHAPARAPFPTWFTFRTAGSSRTSPTSGATAATGTTTGSRSTSTRARPWTRRTTAATPRWSSPRETATPRCATSSSARARTCSKPA